MSSSKTRVCFICCNDPCTCSKEHRPSKKVISCHAHPRYKAIRKPRLGCVLCHAMWQDTLVERERLKKIDDANKAAYHGDIDGDFSYW